MEITRKTNEVRRAATPGTSSSDWRRRLETCSYSRQSSPVSPSVQARNGHSRGVSFSRCSARHA